MTVYGLHYGQDIHRSMSVDFGYWRTFQLAIWLHMELLDKIMPHS